MSDRAVDNETDGDASREPTPAYLRKQINRLLSCADQLVTGFLEGVPNLKPLTALDTLEKMTRCVAALDEQVRKMEGRTDSPQTGTAEHTQFIGFLPEPEDDADGDGA